MPRSRKPPKNLGGRPITVGAEQAYTLRAPRELLEAVSTRAKAESISASEAWRRAAREWLERQR